MFAGLLGLFAYGAYRARRRKVSLLYVVAACFPLLYALAPATLFSQEPKYLVVLSPVLVLLVAQLASTYWRAIALVGVALAVSTGTLHKMDTYFRTVPVRPPVALRDLGPLISTLDGLGVDRVYADFWVAYRLTFDTDERIIAAQNKFTALRFEEVRLWRPDTRSSVSALRDGSRGRPSRLRLLRRSIARGRPEPGKGGKRACRAIARRGGGAP